LRTMNVASLYTVMVRTVHTVCGHGPHSFPLGSRQKTTTRRPQRQCHALYSKEHERHGLLPTVLLLKRASVNDLRDRALSSHHATRDVVAALTSEASKPQGPRLTPSSLDLGKPPLWDVVSKREGECFSFVLKMVGFLVRTERNRVRNFPYASYAGVHVC